MMTFAQVFETSVNVITNSPSWHYTHSDDRTSPSYGYDSWVHRGYKVSSVTLLGLVNSYHSLFRPVNHRNMVYFLLLVSLLVCLFVCLFVILIF